MRIIGKSADTIQILALHEEDVHAGDYIVVHDARQQREMVVQVFEESYHDGPSLREAIVREELLEASTEGVVSDPHGVGSFSQMVRDARILVCKIRGTILDGEFTTEAMWLPSRVMSQLSRKRHSDLAALCGRRALRLVLAGTASDGGRVEIAAEDLDGKLNIIAGKKETGKSHLAKLILMALVEYSATAIVFDLNDEYSGLMKSAEGGASRIADQIRKLVPGKNLRFTLRYLGKSAMIGVLQHALDIPGASLREFARIWENLEAIDSLNLKSLVEAIHGWKCNELVRDALFSRYYTLLSTHLIAEREAEATTLEELIADLKKGGLILLCLKECSSLTRRIAVEIVLSKLLDLLSKNRIPPIFLFAEEAHLYLRETYWDDLVTRMRHFGVFTTFITNQPDAIKENIYRQADNIFMFNFTNDSDLDIIGRASVTDSATIRNIVRTLPPRTCLALGTAVHNLPVIIRVAPVRAVTMGETKLFFSAKVRHANAELG